MKLMYWAFCTYHAVYGRVARGFVLASNQADATSKARRRVTVERKRIGSKLGTLLEPVPSRGRYRVRVWKDSEMATAPTGKHYVERRGTA
jgi:hypothetical protein